MKHTKWKYIVKTLIVVSVLAALLVSMNGCKKKKPDTTESSSTAETTTETTGNTENTKPSVNATEDTTPSQTTAETTETTVALCEHVLGNWIVDETANCTKEGSRHKACTLCGEKVVTEVIPMTAHTASNWLGDAATCTKESTQYQQCTQCDKKLVTIVVDKADHRTGVTPGRAATTTATGLTDYYWCKDCDFEQKHYTIPAEGTVPYEVRGSTITGLGNWTGSELIIPEKINGQTVTAIGKDAFAGKSSIKTVYIPKTVTEIGDKAFSGCSGLTKIVYGGSVRDWTTSVAKATQWNNNTGNYQIHCNNRILSK
ncbi:MAG: leucine-rich repeat protein [Oscillospiraceae bacterium]|nr:leucine-rich repeat protein [Oscillospiraceae bacterium]